MNSERTRKYFELFADFSKTDWEALQTEDSEAQSEIGFLAAMDKIRSAYESSPPATSRIAGYRVIEEIGRGGFAKIYRAEDEQARREVAPKILKSRREMSEEVVARFLREARALAKMRHDNIVRIYHVIDDGNTLGLCMELISGESLDETLSRKGPLTPEEVGSIGHDLASALVDVHKAGFIHRDVKAQNVIRDKESRVVLMDFGISRSKNPASEITARGVLVGTPLAMAPEQYEFRPVDERTDIYALGCLLYRLLTGEYPVSGESMEEIRRKVFDSDYPKIREVRPDVPEDLARVVERAMNRAPNKRHQSAARMRDALRKWAPDAAQKANYPTSVIVLLSAILVALLGILGFLAHLAFRD